MKVTYSYLLALLIAFLALMTANLLQVVVGNAAILIFVLGVTGTALFCGMRPALFCTLASLVLIDYFLLLPTFSLRVVAEADIALLILFIVTAGVATWMADRARALREKAEDSAAQAAAIARLLERQLGELEQDAILRRPELRRDPSSSTKASGPLH